MSEDWERRWRRRLARNPKTHKMLGTTAETVIYDDLPLPRMEDLQRVDGTIDEYIA